jgi:AcrR family transcriptional regulator
MADPLTKRQKQVAAAAGRVFLAQGFTRTTMGDIAAAAGLSRQGLYLAFPNKEAVFTAAVLVLDEQMHATLDEGLRHAEGLRPRLAFVCERWLGGVFNLQRATPDARDMDDLAFPVVRAVYARFVARVASLIEERCGDAIARDEITDLARTLVFGIRGYSATAADGPDMQRLTAL